MKRLFFAPLAVLFSLTATPAAIPVGASEPTAVEVAKPAEPEPLMSTLRSELDYEFEKIAQSDDPAYYMNFRVTDSRYRSVRASFGVLTDSVDSRQRVLIPHLRMGSRAFDNYHGGGGYGGGATLLPLPGSGAAAKEQDAAIRQSIWLEVEGLWRSSVSGLESLLAADRVRVAREDKAPDFSAAPIVEYYEAPLTESQTAFDMAEMTRRVKAYSAVFADVPELLAGSASISFDVERKYFLSTESVPDAGLEKSSVVQNRRACYLMISAAVRTSDGMDMPLYSSYFAFTPEGLPSDDEVLADVKRLAKTLVDMASAPIVTPYTGPALLSGEAAGVFFHEIFGHRVEGQRMKSDNDGQTFKKMVGQSVLPRHFSVYDDPSLESFGGDDLNGYYLYDEQGVRGRRVDVVKDGRLGEFLMTRVPTDEYSASNGHARAQENLDPVSRQSNLVIETSRHLTDAQLRKMLVKEAKAQKCEFGLYFKEVTGGFTMNGRYSPNSFNVTPLEVYKIYVDGRPDELVRGVDLIGTPLSMFANIIEAGGQAEIFTGSCGAESGSVPVTAVSPAVLVEKVEVQRKAKNSEMLPILKRAIPEAETPEATEPAASQNLESSLTSQDEVIFRAMGEELSRSVDSLIIVEASMSAPDSSSPLRPFWIGYIYSDLKTMGISATLGEVFSSNIQPRRVGGVRVLLGDEKMTGDLDYDGGYSTRGAALETDPEQIRREFWLTTDAVYKRAAQELAHKRILRQQNKRTPEEEALADFVPVAPIEKIVEGPEFAFDQKLWEARLAELSAIFKDFPTLIGSRVAMTAYDRTDYSLNSEGVKMRLPSAVAVVSVSATVRTLDGNEFSDSDAIYAVSDLALPSQDELAAWVRGFAEGLAAYAAAPGFEEFYSGPVLFMDQPTFRMFDDNLLSYDRLLVHRKPESQTGGLSPRRLAKRVGQRVLDGRLTVRQLNRIVKEWNGIPLMGYYEISADGVVPPSAGVLIENGILKELLAGRVPTLDYHDGKEVGANSRFSIDMQPYIAPGVLEISAGSGTGKDAGKDVGKGAVSTARLEKELVRLAKADGLKYAYIVERMSGRVNLVWRVDVASGERTLVRGADITRVTLPQLKRLAGVASTQRMRNYLAGQVPSSIIYPEAVLIEDVEIGAMELTGENPSPIDNPLQRD